MTKINFTIILILSLITLSFVHKGMSLERQILEQNRQISRQNLEISHLKLAIDQQAQHSNDILDLIRRK